MVQTDEAVRRMTKDVYALKEQCDKCKLGDKEIGPRSGCEVKKKLVVDRNQVAWKHRKLFLDSKGVCKMYQEKK